MLSVPIILLIVAAVVGIVGIAFAIIDAVKSRYTHVVEPVEKPRWGEELGFSYDAEAVDAAIAQWSHGAAVDGGLSEPRDPAVGEFAGHPAIVFGQDDGLIVAVQRDTATNVVVEIHPQEPATPEAAFTMGRATDLQVYSSDVDAMIRATDDRLVELLNKHPQDLAMAWSEGYWSAALLPLGDDGVDVTPSNDQTIDEQMPYVLNWLANLNDALKVLPPRAGEEEELALEGGGPSRPLVDRSDADSVPADADLIEPEESEFFVEESAEDSDIDAAEDTTEDEDTFTAAGVGLAGATDVGMAGVNNVIPFVPFGGKVDIDDEDAVSQEELDAVVDDIALPEADEPDADDQENGLRLTEEASEYLHAVEEAEAMDAAEDLEWVDHSDDVAEVEPDHMDEETLTADWIPDTLVEPADLSEDGDISAKDDYVTEADFLTADELQPDSDLVDEDAADDTADEAADEVAEDDAAETEPVENELVEDVENAVELPESDESTDLADSDEATEDLATAADVVEELAEDTAVEDVETEAEVEADDDLELVEATDEVTEEVDDAESEAEIEEATDAEETEEETVDADPEPESETDEELADEPVDTDEVDEDDVVDEAVEELAPESVVEQPEDTPASPISFVRPIASPEETGSLPVIKAQETYYPRQEEPVSDDVPVDENGQHDFIVDVPEPEPEPEPIPEPALASEVEPKPAEEPTAEPETESAGGSHAAADEREATMRTGEFPIIRPREEGAGARHVLDEGERPAWFVPGKTTRRSRRAPDDDE